jgi:hypothetical protein
MRALRTVGVSALAIVALMQTSCVVESDQPLIDIGKATLDERILGQWKSVEGDRTVLHFVGRPAGIADCPDALMVLHSVTVGSKQELSWDGLPVYGFTAKVGKDDYFHMIALAGDGDAQRPTDWKKVDIHSYLILKYAITDGRLTYWLMNLDAAAKAIDDGKLKGVVTRSKNKDGGESKGVQGVTFKDSSANLRRFLENGGNTTLFNDKEKIVLTRVKL